MPRRLLDFCQRPTSGQRVADERVAPMVDRERRVFDVSMNRLWIRWLAHEATGVAPVAFRDSTGALTIACAT
jgi:hypothetical protein